MIKILRDELLNNKLAYTIFFIFIVLNLYVSSFHEPWFDEAQSWLIARDNDLIEMMSYYLKYEGHPALWYVILKLFMNLGFSYSHLLFLGNFISSLGVLIFVKYSPFDRIFKILFPFTFFIFYQYSIIARSYILLPVSIFLAAHFYKTRIKNPIPYFVSLVLLTHISAYSAIIAGLLFVVWVIESIELYKKKDILYFLLLLFYASNALVSILTMFPRPEDSNFVPYEFEYEPHEIFNMWTNLSNSLTTYSFLSVIILAVFAFYFYKTKVLHLFLFILLPVLIIFEIVWFNSWHEGIIFLVVIFFLWISIESNNKETTMLLKSSLYLLLATQLVWSFNTSQYDIRQSYSGSKELAEFLITNPEIKSNLWKDKQFQSTSVLAYFDNNIFINCPDDKSFYLWSLYPSCNYDFSSDTPPQYILYGIKYSNDLDIPLSYKTNDSQSINYEEIARFEGAIYWKTGLKEYTSYVILMNSQNNER